MMLFILINICFVCINKIQIVKEKEMLKAGLPTHASQFDYVEDNESIFSMTNVFNFLYHKNMRLLV